MKHSKSAVIMIAFVLAALVLASSGCGGAKEYMDPAVPIEVEEGGEFTIVLESNPTTGYQWKLAEPLDEEILTLIKTEYEEPDEERLGAPGEEKWTFKAEKPGDTEITLAYVRPWEEEPEVMDAEEEPGEEEAEGAEEEGEAEEEESEAQGEESPDEEEGEEPAAISAEEGSNTVTFEVRVVKEGTGEEEAQEYDEETEEPIEVEQYREFIVILESNPTTGYSWQLAQPLDEDILELVRTEFEQMEGEGEGEEGEIMGAPGEEKWTFKAIGEGKTEIDFEYVRPWEKDEPPEEEKTFEVEVKHSEEDEAEE